MATLFLFLLCVLMLLSTAYVRMQTQRFDHFARDSVRSVDLVVARYKEDLGWLAKLSGVERFRRIMIYDKGGGSDDINMPQLPNVQIRALPNVGRCDHTYLWHIVNEWDALADTTVFLPGSGDMQHKWPLVERTVTKALKEPGQSAFVVRRVGDVREEMWDFSLDEWQASAGANAAANPERRLEPCAERPFGRWYEKNFGRARVSGTVYYGIFAVSRDDVRHRERAEYERLLTYVSGSSNPEAGHYFERAWLAVFHPVSERDMVDEEKL